MHLQLQLRCIKSQSACTWLTCAFYNRRHSILNELKKRGVIIHVAGYNVWGANMTLLIRRSKIVLNLHYYEARTLETCRIMESLSLGALVSAAPFPLDLASHHPHLPNREHKL